MISSRHKFIFIHIIRTGGTSIENVFSKEEPPETKHISASACRLSVGDTIWNNYFKFTFVRNPYDRMISYYFWRKNNSWGREAKGKTFEEWLNFIKDYREGKMARKVNRDFNLAIQQQFDQISEGNKTTLDFVGRFENIQTDFDKICGILHVERQKLPYINKQPRRHYSNYYNNKTRGLVEQLYKKDVDFFNYEFEKIKS